MRGTFTSDLIRELQTHAHQANLTSYAGIGSRSTPDDVLVIMYNIARSLAAGGAVLRSGGADGADSAFEAGCDSVGGFKEIFLPWKEYNGSKSNLYWHPPKARELAKQFCDHWDRLNEPVKNLHSRNIQQILGAYVDHPVDFVVCWTPDGDQNKKRYVGGTGTAIACAKFHNIPVFNLRHPNGLEQLVHHVKTLGVLGE